MSTSSYKWMDAKGKGRKGLGKERIVGICTECTNSWKTWKPNHMISALLTFFFQSSIWTWCLRGLCKGYKFIVNVLRVCTSHCVHLLLYFHDYKKITAAPQWYSVGINWLHHCLFVITNHRLVIQRIHPGSSSNCHVHGMTNEACLSCNYVTFFMEDSQM